MKTILDEAEISLISMHDTIQLSSPPWLHIQKVEIIDVNIFTKNNTQSLIYQSKVSNIPKNSVTTPTFYTNGSRDSNWKIHHPFQFPLYFHQSK